MPRLLILLTLPKDVRDIYETRMRARFPDLPIDVADSLAKAEPFVPEADALVTFGPHLRDGKILKHANKLKWVQAVGTGVDGIVDQPLLGKHVIVTNVRGIHGEAVSKRHSPACWRCPAIFRRACAIKLRRNGCVGRRDNRRKTVGIYGIGLIAEALARRCKVIASPAIGFTSTIRGALGFHRMLLPEDCG